MGGGCNYPIAAHAQVKGGGIKIDGLYASADGKVVVKDSIEGHKSLGVQLADQLARQLDNRLREIRRSEAGGESTEA